MGVSLVIPGRNCSRTIRQCLDAVMPLRAPDRLDEIIFVDDGSTDDTRKIVEGYPVRIVAGEGRGPGAARNLGWRAATHDLIWCIDSDCVTEPDALDLLVKQMDDPRVGGAGGSYGNMVPDSLLACLIHEEIVARHARMPARVNYLATFNVIYRRAILEAIGGFDERFVTAEDCELSWRVLAAGHELAFEPRSQVRHYHPMQWQPYLRTQRKHGFYRALLYMNHREYAGGDAYSSFIDHVQPPLAMLIVASLPTLLFPSTQLDRPDPSCPARTRADSHDLPAGRSHKAVALPGVRPHEHDSRVRPRDRAQRRDDCRHATPHAPKARLTRLLKRHWHHLKSTIRDSAPPSEPRAQARVKGRGTL
jgi:GT2 family glycosyltransferase